MFLYCLIYSVLLLAPVSRAHLGGNFSKELEDRRRFLQDSAPNPLHCREQFQRDVLVDSERYQKRALALRSERGLEGMYMLSIPSFYRSMHS